MTVTYSNEGNSIKKKFQKIQKSFFSVTTGQGLVFLKLLLRWQGSVYKLVWKELAAFLCFHYLLHIFYIYVLNQENKKIFDGLVSYAAHYGWSC